MPINRLTIAAAFIALLFVLEAVPRAAAQQVKEFSTRATSVFLLDVDSGAVLYAKDPDKSFSPASLAKLMTAEMTFAALKAGEVTAATEFRISEHAWRTGGAPSRTATMFAVLNSSVVVSDLLQGLIVIFGNDAAIALGEGLAGSEPEFVTRMNARAAELGLRGTAFVNASGLPGEGQKTTMRDVAMLAAHVWAQYPDRRALYVQPDFTWTKITQQNRNPLLKLGIGADGFVTGFAEGEGFSIAATLARGDRRLVLAAAGFESDKQRLEETRAILEWGMSAFDKIDIFAADDIVGQASVFGGTRGSVDLTAKQRVSILIPSSGDLDIRARIIYQGPVRAPVAAGDAVGHLLVTSDGLPIQEVPLYAAEPVEEGGLWQRAVGALYELAFGWFRSVQAG
ncbi:MAG: D-alanyl-D-alanine carboxypeptidase family protein [Mesorhizobium sp.]